MGSLEDVEYFDPLFFHISPTEAEGIDPQHRIFLQEGYKAFEDAGYRRHLLNHKKCGVYLGIMNNEYGMMLYQNRVGASNLTGNSFAVAAARLPYFLNLKGPAIPVDTACSSSLVATHLACQALLNREIDLALAGGVSLYLTPEAYIGMCAAGMLSPDGRCKTFDDSANGFVPGEGAGAMVLKRLKEAESDHDVIYGLIIGSGINQDGKTNGITAPSVNSQMELEREIYDRYGIHPESVSYVEMHGTGTKLGDPIELEALSTVYKETTDKRNYCAIGSVKSNIGHASAASGVASVQKVLLCLKHSKLVPTLNFKKPNEHFNFDESPFYVNTRLKPWKADTGVHRRAAVSSFGFSGTNAHLIIEEYFPNVDTPKKPPQSDSNRPVLFVLSAKSEQQLKVYAESMLNWIESQENLNLADMTYTLQVGRDMMDCRLATMATSPQELKQKLEGFVNGQEGLADLYCSRVKPNREDLALLVGDEELRETIDKWIRRKKFSKLLGLWVKGLSFDWNNLYSDSKPRRISLPTYPFKKERCWLPETVSAATAKAPRDAIQPQPQDRMVEQDQTETKMLPLSGLEQDNVSAAALDYVMDLFSRFLKVDRKELYPQQSFEDFGIDSIMVKELNQIFEADLGRLPSTLLFTYKTMQALSEYFALHHSAKFKRAEPQIKEEKAEDSTQNANKSPTKKLTLEQSKPKHGLDSDDAIAVVGLSGQYPMAADTNEFWQNLKTGKDCITEIPGDRWDYRNYYTPQKGKEGGMYCKWGGFIADIDRFDPLFFNISPFEAKMMDPQERLFLQTVWSCFEDAGYTRKRLEDPSDRDRRGAVGVFAGVTFNNYQLNVADEISQGNMMPVNSQIFSIANRVSYFFNLKGPSLALDTACSSALYAVHLACESLRRKECKMAIAGGVNLSLHPSKYVSLCLTQFAASDGRCRSFGEGGDGYVPGEGVGAVLLKPLKSALKDGDQIYGKILGSAVNHDGKTFGYSVPNPVAQADVVQTALARAGISADSISYIEAHGTGTQLGDPIEITGLSDAFGKSTQAKQFCAIGSVKSNIGHTEAAAGIAQLTKVLLQMKHKMLVPTVLHSGRLNPNIDFTKTPFFVQDTLKEWQPISDDNGQAEEYPKRAGISSFGAGGVNVHVIVEEYIERRTNRSIETSGPAEQKVIIPLSAVKEDNLLNYADSLKRFLTLYSNESNSTAVTLEEIGWTLQAGREPMQHRLAIVAQTIDELVSKLDRFILTKTADPKRDIFYNKVETGKNNAQGGQATPEDTGQMTPESLSISWTQGKAIDWSQTLYKDEKRPRFISLPTYPFSKDQRFWITETAKLKLPVMGRPAEDSAMDVTATNRSDYDSDFLTELTEAPENERNDILIGYLQNLLVDLLEFKPGERPDPQLGFFDMGMASVAVAQFHNLLQKQFDVKMNDSALFEYPTISKLSGYLLELINFDEFEHQDSSVAVQADDDDTRSKEALAPKVSKSVTNENIFESPNSDMELNSHYDSEKKPLSEDEIKNSYEFKLQSILSEIGNSKPESDIFLDLEHISIEDETMLREKVENRLDELLQQIGM